jgi:hypothetical protein
VGLSFAWPLLVPAELVWGTSDVLETFGTAIRVVFLAAFALRLALAPDEAGFLRGNWLTVLALVALLGAGGMLAFEPAAEVEGGFRGFADALWWTAVVMTAMGSA